MASARRLILLALTGTALVGSLSGPSQTFAQAITRPEESAPNSSRPIPIPEIAQRAEDVATLLRQSSEAVGVRREVRDVEGGLASASEWIRKRLLTTTRVLASASSPNTLTNLAESWQLTRSRLTAWNATLTGRERQLERGIEQLDTIRATWLATRTAAVAASVPASLLERIDETLRAIATAHQGVAKERASVLALQERLFQDIARCDDVLAMIEQASREQVGPVFTRDSLPIWRSEELTGGWSNLGSHLREAVGDTVELSRQFLVGQLTRVPLQVALFVAVFALACLARVRAPQRDEGTASELTARQVLELPLSSALVLSLLATRWIYPQTPRAVLNVVGFLVLVPAVLIVRRLASPSVTPAIYALGAFFLADRVREAAWGLPVFEQWLFLMEMVFGIGFLSLTLRFARARAKRSADAAVPWRRELMWLLETQRVAISCAVVVGAVGFMRLARLLGGGVLVSTYVALLLYAAVQVAQGLVAIVLRAPSVGRLFMVKRHRDFLQHRLNLVLWWLAIGAWAYVTLDRLGLMTPLWTATESALDVRYVRGSVNLSLGDLAAFGLTIWAAFLVSSLARFVLREDVYPRVGLSPGEPYALSTLIHYAVVLAGFLLAVAVLGVDLTRVTILAGAFGVGVGIGLQNVVANFVAGLVILFEHPLRVGDAVQVGDVEGEVRQIGNRATTIRTWDGADVLVPNVKLTSERLTNWTLSDRMRRVDLLVDVDFAADAGRVLELLHEVATGQPRVLTEPAPSVLCTGVSDCALHFEVRVWTARFEEAEPLRSELAVAMQRALAAAKIEIPSHGYDIHLRDREAKPPEGIKRCA